MKKGAQILILTLLMFSCSTSKKLNEPSKEFAALYNPSEYSLNIDYQVHHLSDEMTSLYIRLYPEQLLFNQANTEGEMRALVQINSILYALDEAGEISEVVDSLQIDIKLGKDDQERKSYFISKVLDVPAGKRYLIRLNSKDMLRGTVGLAHLFIDKVSVYSAQNFSILGRNGYPKFYNYFRAGEVFRIHYRSPGVDSAYLDFFSSDSLFPRPPVSMDTPSSYPMEADTTIRMAFSDTMFLTLPEVGTYHLRINKELDEGLTLMNFGSDYPRTMTENSLLGPLFYVATLTEFRQLSRAENLKMAVDEFWLGMTSSSERARELIRVYYNRVLYSNLYFTEDREGWKTDRGALFIMCGPPDRMKDDGLTQHWYYIASRQGKVIEYIFERENGLYSNQNLIWKKNTENMQYWSAAISSWRSGKIYSLGRQ